MEIYVKLFEVIFPVFFIIGIGYFIGKKDKKFDDKVNKFLRFMMDNFDTELVVMGIKLALTQYQLPIDPDKVKCFDEFHEKYGKYVTAAQSIK